MFDMLAAYVPGARVLDGFAGSGALALEALSRGASHAALIENAPEALAVIRKNIASLGMADRARVIPGDFFRVAGRLAVAGERFDIVLLDPPYAIENPGGAVQAVVGLCTPGAVISLEHARGGAPPAPPGLAVIKSKTYGDTGITIYTLEGGA